MMVLRRSLGLAPPGILWSFGPTRRFAYFPAQTGCRLETPEPGGFRTLTILRKSRRTINNEIEHQLKVDVTSRFWEPVRS